MDTKFQRKTPRQPNISLYLGNKEKRAVRLARLDSIATSFGVTRSVLIQKIADGELEVVKAVDFPPEGE